MTTTKKVNHSTKYTNTDNLDQGNTKVRTDGKAGVRTLVHTEVRHNGKLQSRKLTSSKITTAPRTEVVLRGTREPEPEPRNEPANNNDSNNDSSNNSNSNNSNSNSSSNQRQFGKLGSQRRRPVATAFITGYTWWDNSPPGSAQIARPVLHQRAGGNGTYSDPITVAVGLRAVLVRNAVLPPRAEQVLHRGGHLRGLRPLSLRRGLHPRHLARRSQSEQRWSHPMFLRCHRQYGGDQEPEPWAAGGFRIGLLTITRWKSSTEARIVWRPVKPNRAANSSANQVLPAPSAPPIATSNMSSPEPTGIRDAMSMSTRPPWLECDDTFSPSAG